MDFHGNGQSFLWKKFKTISGYKIIRTWILNYYGVLYMSLEHPHHSCILGNIHIFVLGKDEGFGQKDDQFLGQIVTQHKY